MRESGSIMFSKFTAKDAIWLMGIVLSFGITWGMWSERLNAVEKKADAVDEALNIKGTRKERTEQRYQMLKELLGEDKAKDIRTDAGYNLMMTGLMIAAGRS